ncbi:MAG: TonB-dependent receptor [Bacteroidetes bacterium]|nr:MAG: TonB-dependent receptor [Bacteroidota bacterium]
MKRTLIFAALVSMGFIGMAQFPAPGAGGKGQSIPNIGHIYGKVVDSAGHPISDATVILLQNKYDSASKKRKDVLFKGLSTKANGEFNFEELPLFGGLKLKISATGYKVFEQNVAFQMKMPANGGAARQSGDPAQAMNAMSGMINSVDKDLGNIKMTVDMKQLAVVTVTASKPTVRMDIDKKVYNVEKDMVNAGGTALDVMKNVPSVSVDIDGNVTLRNAAPQIYIDGRPTTLTLDQIPADAIESVEVITNPSAKYDASGGSAGILNIVLKKNRKTGYNGNFRLGVDSRGGINGGGNFNLRQNKFNFTAAGFVNQNRGVTKGTNNRTDYTNPATPTNVDQSVYSKNKGAFVFGSLGFDYFMTNRTTFSLSGIKVHGRFTPTETDDIYTSILYPDSATNPHYSQRNTNSTREFNANGLQFGFKHLFPTEGETLTIDGNYFAGKNSSQSLYVTDYYTDGPGSIKNGLRQQKLDGDGNNKFITIQSDYVRPFNAKTKLEAGVRFNTQQLVNNQYNYLDTLGNGIFIPVPSASTNYKNTNDVYAGYVSFTSAIRNFGYQVGLRGESSDYKGELTNTKETFSHVYPISLFPSVFLSQKLGKKQELQMSYTRRINRPNFFQLIPYTDYTDSLNITRGNPDLVPEFTNSLEFSYLKTLKGNNTIMASVYYKHTDHLITRYLDTVPNPITGKTELINTYVNANSSQTMGAELTSVTTLTKWWDLTANVNIYNSKINTENLSQQAQNALWSWFGKLNTNFKLPAKLKLQITGIYQSKTNLPINTGGGGFGPPGGGAPTSASQGYIAAFWAVDAALSRSFLKQDAATLSIAVSDIFRTRWSKQHSEGPTFVQDYDRLRDPQLVRVNFTWRFGKMDVSLFKRKNFNNSGSQDAMQGMQ